MKRIETIRNEEKKYHDACYDNYKLFEEGSWLYKPVQTVMELVPFFQNIDHAHVLDLGCGVGRNSIPIAEAIKGKNGVVTCVDLLDSAIHKLESYSREYGVNENLKLVKADIGKYPITENKYDLIVAVSSIEHVESEEIFDQVLHAMSFGTKVEGINCIIVNSEVEEWDMVTNEKLDALMEINLSTEQMLEKLKRVYDGWELMKQLVKPLEYSITRNERVILLKTNAITYVVRKH